MKTLFINSKVWTGNGNFYDAVGFDTDTGKITFTGNSHESDKIRHEYNEVIDLNKKLVLPAFTDGHCHFIKGAYINSQLNLRNASTIREFTESIKKYRSEKGITWIYGGYFSESNFKEAFTPGIEFLDKICSDVPLIISRFDLHSAFVNTKAVELSGILSREKEFTSEEIVKEENVFTGEVKERARDFILDKIPEPDLHERTETVLKLITNLHSSGITSISDITLPEDLEVYKELINREKLLLNVDSRLPFTEAGNIEKYKREFGEIPGRIKFNSLKAFYDGSLSSKTAYMFSDYKNTGSNGIRTEYAASGDFEKAAFEIDKAGYQISVHAIGDKAVSELLDLNEEIIRQNGRRDRRFRIEHAQHISESDFMRFRDLNVIASVQPSHLFSDAKTATAILTDPGTEHNYRKLFDLGVHVCFGTDFPVVSENPFETLHYAVTRKAEGFPDGFYNDLRIPLSDCLKSYTYENSYASFDEKKRGTLTPGKDADLIVLEEDIFISDENEIKNGKVYMTYFLGQRVF